jgi:transposase
LRLLLESARTAVSELKHLWLEAGYEGRGKRWAEEILGLSVEVVRKPSKPIPEKVAKVWAQEWAKEGEEIDWQKLMPPRGFRVLPRRWVVERTFSWLSEQEDEQGLREALRQCRSVRLRSHDSADGEAPGPCLRISRQFLQALG